MATNFEKVKEFHVAFDVPVGGHKPEWIDEDRLELRKKLMEEELKEYLDAVEARDLVEVADALADLLYVTYGTMVEYGLPADHIFTEVHRSNMSKLGEDGKPVYRDDGKVLKGPNFSPPDIANIIDFF